MSKERPGSPSFDLPDLELPQPAPSQRRMPVRETSALTDDDDFELVTGGTPLDLAEPFARAELAANEAASAMGPAWPSGHTPSADRLPVDANAVLALADYPTAEGHWLAAPAYAFAVFGRQRELKRRTTEHFATLRAAEQARDADLANVARELRGLIEAHPTEAARLGPLRELERQKSKRRDELTSADSGFRERTAAFEQSQAERKREHEAAKLSEASTRTGLEAAESDFRRVEAKHKRLEIESRGVHDLIQREGVAEGQPLPAAHAARLAQLSTKAQALAPDLAHARASLDGARKANEESARTTQQLAGELRRLEREHASQASQLEKQLRLRQRGLSRAQIETQAAWADLGRHVLAARGAVPVPAARLAELNELEKVVESRAIELELHVRAQSAFDREHARRGVLLVAFVFLALVLAIALGAML